MVGSPFFSLSEQFLLHMIALQISFLRDAERGIISPVLIFDIEADDAKIFFVDAV
jgi:hypothetical protein